MWILADMHVHSNHSFDGTSSLGEMCRAAVDLGITKSMLRRALI